MTESTNNRISDLINSQAPFFVSNDHPAFVDFMEAYFEYLEQSGKTINRADNISKYRDVDKTVAEFSDHLYSTFLQAIPKNSAASQDIVIKHVKDFYRARGTEKSLKFLLRILFNQEATVYYPKQDILRASDGKWYIQKSLRVTNTAINTIANTNLSGLELFVNRRVRGATSNASATIERVDRFYEAGLQVDELVLSNIDGEFNTGELVYTIYSADGSTVMANTYINAGVVRELQILKSGNNYTLTDPIVFQSTTGSGAIAKITRISTGNIQSLTIESSGAGHMSNDVIFISGGGGTGANAIVTSVTANNYFHPNTYNIYSTTIEDMAGTLLSANLYPNLSTSIVSSPNANSSMIDTLQTLTYGPCGPVETTTVTVSGNNYTSIPLLYVSSNNFIKSVGILGRMEIVSGGTDYVAGDMIEFVGGSGIGASANVRSVNGTGSITSVGFVQWGDYYVGGVGYLQSDLPTTNVVSNTGSGANIVVTSIIGEGAEFGVELGAAGKILEVSLQAPGSGYVDRPTINMSAYGDGTANIRANVTQGIYTYPGRFLNDDGFLSSTNYLQDRDYYQNFSYVVKLSKSLSEYRQTLLSLVHPTGTKLFGVYEKVSII